MSRPVACFVLDGLILKKRKPDGASSNRQAAGRVN